MHDTQYSMSASIVTWILVFVGWAVIHMATLSRERRKERREFSEKLIDELRSLGADARNFHIAGSFGAHHCDTLRYKTERIIRRLQRPPMSALDIPIGRMVKLRKSITLNNSDPSSFSSQTMDSVILSDIRVATDDLIDAIELKREDHWA